MSPSPIASPIAAPIASSAPVTERQRTAIDKAVESDAPLPTAGSAMQGISDALQGTPLLTAHFVDPIAAPGSADAKVDLQFTNAAPLSDRTFATLDDAIAGAKLISTQLAGSVDPANGLAVGQIIVNLGRGGFGTLAASLPEDPAYNPHPATAENEPAGAGTGWKPFSAASFTANSPLVVALVDGLGNAVPQDHAAPGGPDRPARSAPTPSILADFERITGGLVPDLSGAERLDPRVVADLLKPVTNPDGRQLDHSAWRRGSSAPANADHGVDLNREYPTNWGSDSRLNDSGDSSKAVPASSY